MIPKTKPKILDNVYYDKEEIGKIGGIILNSFNTNREEMIESLIYGIEKIKEDNMDSLIMEKIKILNREDIQLIEKSTNLKVYDGRKLLILYLPFVLKSIYKGLREDLKEKEVLIISDEIELTKKIIESINKEIRFVTLIGDDKNNIEDISEYILHETGLSLFYSKNIDKILTNYSIIINLKDNTYIDMARIRKEALIFDLSLTKSFNSINKNRRAPIVIEDFVFELKGIESNWVGGLVFSHIYEYFSEFNVRNLKGLLTNDKVYSIEEFIEYKIAKQGKKVST